MPSPVTTPPRIHGVCSESSSSTVFVGFYPLAGAGWPSVRQSNLCHDTPKTSNVPTMKSSKLNSLVSRNAWAMRILTFNPTWFACAMGTGAINQVLVNFPFNAQWLENLAYCFWILDIALVAFFLILFIARIVKHPSRCSVVFYDPAQASPLGTIPISIDTIAVGISSFYASNSTAIWVAYTLWWIAISLSIFVACIFIFALTSTSEPRSLPNISGVYLLAFIPFIVGSATGSSLAPYLPPAHASSTVFVSFLLVSFGLLVCLLITTVYIHRLLTQPLLPRGLLLTSFIPIGPVSMSAYSIQGLATALPHVLTTTHASFAPPPPALALLATLPLLALGTFFLLHALAALAAARVVLPARLTPVVWAVVFPLGVYADGLVRAGAVLRSVPGLAGPATALTWWGAVSAGAVVLAWLVCAGWSFWRGVWRGEIAGEGIAREEIEKDTGVVRRDTRRAANPSSRESQDTLVEGGGSAGREDEV